MLPNVTSLRLRIIDYPYFHRVLESLCPSLLIATLLCKITGLWHFLKWWRAHGFSLSRGQMEVRQSL